MSDHSDPERGFMGGAAGDACGKAAEETSPAIMTSEIRIAMATARMTAGRPPPSERGHGWTAICKFASVPSRTTWMEIHPLD